MGARLLSVNAPAGAGNCGTHLMMRRTSAGVIAVVGFVLVVAAVVQAPGVVLEVLARGAEPEADHYEAMLIRLIAQSIVGVVLIVFGVRSTPRSDAY